MTNWCCLATGTVAFTTQGDLILYYGADSSVQCEQGWTGPGCSICAPTYGLPGQCNTCRIGWAGDDCHACALGWAGNNCDACAPRFEPPGECSRCITGWGSDTCDVCRFGFDPSLSCSSCIQTGHWTGEAGGVDINVYLTFTGPNCSEMARGAYYLTICTILLSC